MSNSSVGSPSGEFGVILRWLGILAMLAGLTIFVVGVFVANRDLGLVVALSGIGVMLSGVALTNHAQGSDVGPGS
jgi:hypothetical protein